MPLTKGVILKLKLFSNSCHWFELLYDFRAASNGQNSTKIESFFENTLIKMITFSFNWSNEHKTCALFYEEIFQNFPCRIIVRDPLRGQVCQRHWHCVNFVHSQTNNLFNSVSQLFIDTLKKVTTAQMNWTLQI